MKRFSSLLTLLTVALLGGCGSTPTAVTEKPAPAIIGQWRADNLPDSMPEKDTSMSVFCQKDHTFAMVIETTDGSPAGGLHGTWANGAAPSQFKIHPVNDDDAVAQLVDPSTLLIVSGKDTVKFHRVHPKTDPKKTR